VMNELIDVVNHEMTHDWIGGKINTGYNQGARSMRWMTEGFSDYYAMRNRWKTGRWTAMEFFKRLNEEVIEAHYKDPCAELTMAVLEAHYFDSLSYEMVPYRRGCILAFYLDCMIRARTGNEKTLHHYMMDLLDYSYGRSKNLEENSDFVFETLEDYIGPIAPQILIKHGFDGKKISFKAFELPDFIQMEIDPTNRVRFSLRSPEAESDFLK
jgi:predicted metalloprotease with PDZ domain